MIVVIEFVALHRVLPPSIAAVVETYWIRP